MATLENGLWLQQYLEPQLLESFRNYKDDFIGVLRAPNPGAIGTDGIKFNKLTNNVSFKINSQDDFTPQQMTGQKTLVSWDKLDTTPTAITDAELRGLVFDKNSAVRQEHENTFKIGVRDYVLSKLAPTKNVDGETPVLRTTGATVDSRKRLTYADLLTFENRVSLLNLTDSNSLYLVLSDEHRSDLLVDRSNTNNYRDIDIDPNTGELRRFFRLKFFQNNDTPLYDSTGNLKSLGSVKGAGDQKASVFFYAPNTVYWIENVMVLFKPMQNDTRNKDPQSEVRLHTYGLCDKRQEYGFGAIISDNA